MQACCLSHVCNLSGSFCCISLTVLVLLAACLQLEGFKLQREQKLGEESETKKKLEAAKTELARNQGDPDVPNHPDVLAAVRDAYQSAQVSGRATSAPDAPTAMHTVAEPGTRVLAAA